MKYTKASSFKFRGDSKSRCNSLILPGITVVFALIWLLAVVKVFVLEGRKSTFQSIFSMDDASPAKLAVITDNSKASIHIKSHPLPDLHASVDTSHHRILPSANEWLFIRASPNYVVNPDHGKISINKNSLAAGKSNPIVLHSQPDNAAPAVSETKIKPASELSWPPVRILDGSIPDDEGFDSMPLTNLKVPRFWAPKDGEDINRVGTKINGQETIFLMIASYRDFQCRETITSAFNKADHPERLFVGAVDQVVPGDTGCLDIDIPCDKNPNQPICKYRNQIAVFKMDAQYATGPVTARHIGDRMYRGEYFVMQMDAHCLFVRHWDTNIVNQWKSTHNEMAVLSSYLTDVQGSIDANGDSTRNTRPIMCNSDFEGAMPARYLRHGSQPEDVPTVHDMPQLQPFWAAGFSFSRGHFKIKVPYDGYQPMVFQGEEIAIGIRGFTFGYDFYAPRDSVVFHEYAEKSSRRKKIHMFWENGGKHEGEAKKSLARATSIIGMARDIDPASWDHREEEKYGLGNVRTLELFYKLFLIDPIARKAVQLCPFVKTGIMHNAFQKYLRPDGLGIDYTSIESYDTRQVLLEKAKQKAPQIEKMLRNAMAAKDKSSLDYALYLAREIKLEDLNPKLYNEANSIFQSF